MLKVGDLVRWVNGHNIVDKNSLGYIVSVDEEAFKRNQEEAKANNFPFYEEYVYEIKWFDLDEIDAEAPSRIVLAEPLD